MSHLHRELELNGLEGPNELQINSVTQQAVKATPEKPKPTFHHCKKPSQYRNQCRHLKREKKPAENNKKSAGNNNNNNGGQTNSISNNKMSNNTHPNNAKTEMTRNQELSTRPMKPVVKQTITQKNVTLELTQPVDLLPGADDRTDRLNSNKGTLRTFQKKLLKLQPKI